MEELEKRKQSTATLLPGKNNPKYNYKYDNFTNISEESKQR